MNSIGTIIPALAVGTLLGIFFYGGLWFTVKTGLHSNKPFLWFAGSFILRLAVVVTVLYLFVSDSWLKMVVALAGFIISKSIFSGLKSKERIRKNQFKNKVSHENQS